MMKVAEYVKEKRQKSERTDAAALDTAPNVAARVLAIHPRYKKLSEAEYTRFFGIKMHEKAAGVAAALVSHPDNVWLEDTPGNRKAASQYLTEHEDLLGRLASLVQDPSTPAQVLTEELDEIFRRRATPGSKDPNAFDDPVQRAIGQRLVGLAFSGGGIRSATFNLGILQALADDGLLGHVDYLSTVSGGGYIGSWLAACIQKESSLAAVEKRLSPAQASPSDPEPESIQFLRDYSNYLTPRTGMFSADTWTIAMIWSRNTFLNLIVLIFTGLSVLLVPRLLAFAQEAVRPSGINQVISQRFPTSKLSLIAMALMFIAAALIGYNLRSSGVKADEKSPWYQRQHGVQLAIVVPALIAALLGSYCLWNFLSNFDYPGPFPWGNLKLYLPAVGVLFMLLAAQVFGDFWGCFKRDKSRLPGLIGAPTTFIVYPLFSAGVFLGSFLLIGRLMWEWDYRAGRWHALSFGAPLILVAFALTMTIEIGLMGRSFPDDRREWIGRLGAWVTIFSLGTLALFTISLYGPLLVAWLIAVGGPWMAGLLPAGWMGTTIGALLAGKKQSSDKKDEKQQETPFLKKLLITVGPYVFIGGLLLLLTYALHLILSPSACPTNQEPDKPLAKFCNANALLPPAQAWLDAHWDLIDFTKGWWTLGAFLVSAFIAWLFSTTVDINDFSMHHFYKNRLVRCFLGASRAKERAPNPFTGFDADDERRLCMFRHDAVEVKDGKEVPKPYRGPYPIINTTLNLVHGERLSWQERKGSSFIFTPKYSGWNKETNVAGAWVDSATYRITNVYAYPTNESNEGGIGLGTAVAISGAAASPNMGYQSSPPLAFLMTVFNVRLGWWLGNPALDAWRESGPNFGLNYLLTELFGLTNDSRKYMYLSDGGHFENLGIYELVRRRCLLIVACDAEQDGEMTFGGLGNAIRKCRTDFGVEIQIDVSRLRKDSKTGLSQEHCAVGTIRYPDRDRDGRAVTGTLVYIKSSITGDEPADVLEYRSRDAAFPHQTTADQFFDESQFESYRRLGYHIGLEELHPGKLVLLYAESVARLDEERRSKFKNYHSRIAQLIDSTNESELGSLREHIRPLMTHLLARPGQPANTPRAKGVHDEPTIQEFYKSLLRFMADAIEGEKHQMNWSGEHAALLTLFDHWTRLTGFAGQFGIQKDSLDPATKEFFQKRLGL